MTCAKELMREIQETEVPYGCLAVWFLGQASVILKGDGVTVYIDPYVTSNSDRSFPPPITAEEITHAGICLITHDHGDHLDEVAIPVIAGNNPELNFMAPSSCHRRLLELGVQDSQLTAAKAGDWIQLTPKLPVFPVAAAHEVLEYDDQGLPRYVGYILELNGVKVYHAGDTVLYPDLVETLSSHNIDLAMLPINGYDYFRGSRGIAGNMNYREAAEFAATAGFEMVIPLHYDLFVGNAENPGYFVDYMYRHFPKQKQHVMARAERFVYVTVRAFKTK